MYLLFFIHGGEAGKKQNRLPNLSNEELGKVIRNYVQKEYGRIDNSPNHIY